MRFLLNYLVNLVLSKSYLVGRAPTVGALGDAILPTIVISVGKTALPTLRITCN